MSDCGAMIIQETQPTNMQIGTVWIKTSVPELRVLKSMGPDVWTMLNPQATFAASATDLSTVIATLNSVIAALKTAGLMAS